MQTEDSKVDHNMNNDVNSGVAVTRSMLAAASAEGVFGELVQSGETTVITASEIVAAMGAGGAGANGGGGGTAVGRPVAVISIEPNGQVAVTPIVDPTKIALAFITVLGSFLVMTGKMRKAGSELLAKNDG